MGRAATSVPGQLACGNLLTASANGDGRMNFLVLLTAQHGTRVWHFSQTLALVLTPPGFTWAHGRRKPTDGTGSGIAIP